jgi:hypothetical protein
MTSRERLSQSPPRKLTNPYLAPGVPMPCECLIGDDGRIAKMTALCPEHGYLIRRLRDVSDDSDEQNQESDEIDKGGGTDDDSMNV